MAAVSDPDLLVLHCLRLKDRAPVETVAELTGLDPRDVAELIDTFAGKAWVRHRDGVAPGWSLTPAGRVEDAGRLADELEATGTRAEVEAAYDEFLALNQRFLQACTDWQLRPAGPAPTAAAAPGDRELNDHTDAAWDRVVLAELDDIDAAVRPVCARLAAALARFAHYDGRFSRALRHIRANELDWFARPVLDSYHTVWFELHADLLATLGLDRSHPDARSA